ncbi:hypothetical protein [Hyphomonas johnsonii]|nr:hypothetical protein [Hyphomonas johnsonii]
MANVQPIALSDYHPRIQALETRNWARGLVPKDITHFLTVTLKNPDSKSDPEKWNVSSSPQRRELISHILFRFDKRLYGKSHINREASKKFQFFMLEENRDKCGHPTFAHIHGAFAFGASELVKLADKWPTIETDIIQLVLDEGLEPNVCWQTADDGIAKYITKNAEACVETIAIRA